MTITFTPRPLSTSNITTSYTTRTNSYQRLLLTPGPGGNFISIRNIGLTLINDLATVLCWCLFTDQFVIMGNFVSVTMTANSFVTLKTEEVLARFPGVEHPWVWKIEGQFIRVPTVTISHFSNFFLLQFPDPTSHWQYYQRSSVPTGDGRALLAHLRARQHIYALHNTCSEIAAQPEESRLRPLLIDGMRKKARH